MCDKDKVTMTKNKFEPYDDEVKEVTEIKAFFRKIARTLNQFAIDHNLKIDKYYHRGPNWDLLFRHPIDGYGYISVDKVGDRHVKLVGYWSLDDVDSGIYYNRHTDPMKYPITKEVLIQGLTELLQTMLGWTREDLTVIGKRGPDAQDVMTHEQQQAYYESFPMPVL